MPTTLDEILSAAMQLSPDERLQVAQRLMETLPDDVEGSEDQEEFHKELERRSGDWEGSISWEELRAELGRNQ